MESLVIPGELCINHTEYALSWGISTEDMYVMA